MESAAITALLPKLGAMLTDEYKLHSSVKAGVKDLEDELRSMQTALDNVSSVPPGGHGGGDDEQLDLWARKVRELADDTVDSYLVRVSTKPGPSSRPWGACLLPAARRYKARRHIAAEIERIKSEVKKASERLRTFSIPDARRRSPPAARVDLDPRLHLYYENATRLVGMHRSTERLIRLLSPQGDGDNDDLSLKVVALVGAGGIGKTTLARSFRCLRSLT